MNCHHLRKAEVAYELKIRGQPTEGTADELRKRLNACFSNNTPEDKDVVNSLNTETELDDCEEKLADLVGLVEEYEGNFKDNAYNRILARLHHLALRIQRIPIAASVDIEPQQSKDALLKEVTDLTTKFSETTQNQEPEPKKDEKKTPPSVDQSDGGRVPIDRDNVASAHSTVTKMLADVELSRRGTRNDKTTAAGRETEYYSTLPSLRTSSVPVFKWNLKFDNESGQSVGSFLQRVEELRRARGVSHVELFDSAVDLFAGQALVWYRSAQGRVKSWDELCQEMRVVFQTPDYKFRLQREIMNRTQGDSESIDMFMAAMEGLYGRLAEPVPEKTRLAQILNNLHPHLLDRLSLCDIRTLEELRNMGRRAEAGRFRATFSHQQPKSTALLEPDLSYSEPVKKKGYPMEKLASIQRYSPRTSSSVACWNCQEVGHRFSECQKERQKFCFGCGRVNVIKSKCPSCNPKKLVSVGASCEVTVDSQCHEKNEVVQLNYIFQTAEQDPRPYLQIRVFGKMYRALLDSGASHTVLGEEGMEILDRFPAKMRSLDNRWVETADTRKHKIRGYVMVPITLEGRTRSVKVFVVPSVKQALILGIDFWESMQLVADLHQKTWEFAPVKLKVSSLELGGGLHTEEHLSPEEGEKLKNFVDREFNVLTDTNTLGKTCLVEHTIDTGEASPIKQRYYPLSPARLQCVYDELDKMINLGVVVPSKSAWASPIVLLDKPDGSKRFCVNYRKLNAVTKRDAYPLPQVTVILDRLRDAGYLSSLDIKSAYWQIPMAKESQDKTAFTVPGRGLYEFTRMPFGLHNAPATWQRFIDSVIGGDLEPHVFVYLDDVIVITSTFDHHLEVLREIFKRLRSANVTLNREKCRICRPNLRYLGYIVDQRGLKVDPEKVESIVNIPVPTSQKAVRQFVGTASWYRRFIPDFATRMHPLTQLLRKNQKFKWSEEEENAFQDIRSCLIKAPILTCPDFSQPFIISCDASGVGLGAVLSQQGLQGEQVVAYASRTLTKEEQKHSATERECLAVIFAIERFRPYVEGTEFTVVTDHYSLLWLHNLKDPQGRLARWALRLQPYNFKLVHRKGKEHVVPDMLSRTVAEEEDVKIAVVENRPPEDKWYANMKQEVERNGADYPLWAVQDNKLKKFVTNHSDPLETMPEWKEVVPKHARSGILAMMHDEPTAGHLGVQKTFSRIQNLYY